ncbi:MAG: hypothetical protein ACK58T_15655, partial [Phycisphaerae bacterium]
MKFNRLMSSRGRKGNFTSTLLTAVHSKAESLRACRNQDYSGSADSAGGARQAFSIEMAELESLLLMSAS